MAAVQMNVRIDEELKERGDEVFARWGLTPSQVVRAVWGYAEEKGEPPAFMRPDDDDEAERQRRIKLVEEGAHIVESCLKQCGGSGRIVDAGLSREEMRDLMYGEMLDEVEALQ